MAYYTDLFSPETYDYFSKSDKTISGFRTAQNRVAKNVNVGDKFICYVTKLSRWIGVLEVTSKTFTDNTPIFTNNDDPFIIRFTVKPIVWLNLEQGIPVHEKNVWNNLTFTKDYSQNTSSWTGKLRGSLRKLEDADGKFLEKILLEQNIVNTKYPIEESDKKKLKIITVKTQDSKEVTVAIPENDEVITTTEKQQITSQRDSTKIQALLAEIGERMNLKIWLPKNDRLRVLELWHPTTPSLLDILPLNYDDATLKTIENIDVLWIHGRSIVRAFEVEHTTSIYSGILRMADLMALQPNLTISAHIVAPSERKDKVLQEISRPVFAFLERGPLTQSCTFLSYDSIEELSGEKRLEYMNDSVLSEYEVFAEDSDI